VRAGRRSLFADAPRSWISKQFRFFAPLGLGVGLLVAWASGERAPFWFSALLGVGLALAWGVGFPIGNLKRHRTAVLRIANGREIEIWTLRRQRTIELALPPEKAFELARRAVGRVGGKVTGADEVSQQLEAATPYGVTLDIAISPVEGAALVRIMARPKRNVLLADDGATLRVLDLIESVLRNGLRAPLPEW
jgi:hypothetical protein